MRRGHRRGPLGRLGSRKLLDRRPDVGLGLVELRSLQVDATTAEIGAPVLAIEAECFAEFGERTIAVAILLRRLPALGTLIGQWPADAVARSLRGIGELTVLRESGRGGFEVVESRLSIAAFARKPPHGPRKPSHPA